MSPTHDGDIGRDIDQSSYLSAIHDTRDARVFAEFASVNEDVNVLMVSSVTLFRCFFHLDPLLAGLPTDFAPKVWERILLTSPGVYCSIRGDG